MQYIALIAVTGILLLQWSGGIPSASVGGPMTIGLALMVAALAVGVHEAWTSRRGVIGWLVNIFVSLISTFLVAPLVGMFFGMVLGSLNSGRSLAAAGGPLLSVALVGMILVVLLGAWGALRLVNQWR